MDKWIRSYSVFSGCSKISIKEEESAGWEQGKGTTL